MPTIVMSGDPQPQTYNLSDTKLTDLENDFSNTALIEIGVPNSTSYEDQMNAEVKGTITGMQGQKDIVIGHLVKLPELDTGQIDDSTLEIPLPRVREISGEFVCDHQGFTIHPCWAVVSGTVSGGKVSAKSPKLLPAHQRGHAGGFQDDENGQTCSVLSQLIINSVDSGYLLNNIFSPVAFGWMIRNTKQSTSDALDMRYQYTLNVRSHNSEQILFDPTR